MEQKYFSIITQCVNASSLVPIHFQYVCDCVTHVLQHNYDKRMEVKNSYMPLSCFVHVSYRYMAQNMDEFSTL